LLTSIPICFALLVFTISLEEGRAGEATDLTVDAWISPSEVKKGGLSVLKVRVLNETEKELKWPRPVSVTSGTMRILQKPPLKKEFVPLYPKAADTGESIFVGTRTLKCGEAATVFRLIRSDSSGLVFKQPGKHQFKIKVDLDYDQTWEGQTVVTVRCTEGKALPENLIDRESERLGGVYQELLPAGIWPTKKYGETTPRERIRSSKKWLRKVAAKTEGTALGLLLKWNLALKRAVNSDRNLRREISQGLQKVKKELGQVVYESALLNLSKWAGAAEKFTIKKEFLDKLVEHNPKSRNLAHRLEMARKEIENKKEFEAGQGK